MHTIKTVVLTHEECQVIYKASRFINLVYPVSTDPLVPKGRGVDERHPSRRALNLNAMETLTYERLALAQQTLTAIRDQMIQESSVDHWLSLTEDPDDETAQKMAHALAAERSGQQRLAREALEVVDEALTHLDPASDSWERVRKHKWDAEDDDLD